MAYVDPKSVLSPKGRIRSVHVLFDTGSAAGRDGWAAADVEFDGRPRLGLRWNGAPEEGVGNPQSRGNPTWFIVPDEIASGFRPLLDKLKKRQEESLAAGYAAMAADQDRESEAMEWVEGLVGDSA